VQLVPKQQVASPGPEHGVPVGLQVKHRRVPAASGEHVPRQHCGVSWQMSPVATHTKLGSQVIAPPAGGSGGVDGSVGPDGSVGNDAGTDGAHPAANTVVPKASQSAAAVLARIMSPLRRADAYHPARFTESVATGRTHVRRGVPVSASRETRRPGRILRPGRAKTRSTAPG
jgi:hypothetical protein